LGRRARGRSLRWVEARVLRAGRVRVSLVLAAPAILSGLAERPCLTCRVICRGGFTPMRCC